MAEAFLQVLLENLSSLIQAEIGLIMGVDTEMNKLSNTLTTIQAVLEDAEVKQLENKPLRDWLRKLNDLTYEIDDILDECSTEVSKMEHKYGKLSRYSLKKILYRHKIGRRMKEVTGKLDDVAAERAKFHLREIVVERQSKLSIGRETGSLLSEQQHVYGRDVEKQKIVDILVNQVRDFDELSILPIVGIGGLGKTTFAKLVYNEEQVTDHFDIKIWVCVSDNFDIKTLIKAMIESANGNASDSNSMCLDTLQQQIWRKLNKKRYLLVLDDVWNEDQHKWDDFQKVLACGSSGSSIILTTRLKKVADIMSTLPTHYLKGLPEEDCWLLFKQRAFGQEKKEYHKLEVIGKKIVKKCGGVPLAAKSLGSLLRFKRDEKGWLHVEGSDLWNLPQEETAILPALKISYHHLPYALRHCFAYCAVFPKDTEINKDELIFLWMAHGYISSNGILEVEDVGNEVCSELVLRSLLENVDKTYDGKTKFKMHDLVHDLAKSIMENKVPQLQAESDNARVLNSKIREVNLVKRYVAFPTSDLLITDVSSTLINFTRLRMLNASGKSTKDLPSAIGNLKHLRYLNLSYSEIQTLPNTICSLWNLKILKLNCCYKLVSLPKNMRYMRNLRHIFLKFCNSLSHMPSKISELTSLKTLSKFIVGEGRGNQLEELQFLNLGGKLEIRHLERVENHLDAKKANLAEKQNIRDLYLEWNGASKSGEDVEEKILEVLEPHPSVEKLTIEGFRGKHFPLWMRSSTLANIVHFELWNCPNLVCLPQVLGELPRLKNLALKYLGVKYIVEEEVQGDNSIKPKFPSVELLFLRGLSNLERFIKGGSVEMFPNIETLCIEDCSSLILPHLPSLTTFYCSSATLNSFSNLNNLQHLSITMDNSTTCVPYETLEKLSKLERLDIQHFHEHSLPEEGLKFFKSLTWLQLVRSETLTCLPEVWLSHLISLQFLNITGCPEFVEIPEGIKCLHALKSLHLSNLPKMVRLPESIQHLSSLKYLCLGKLTNLTLLPVWLENLSSLEVMTIDDCPMLSSLPANIKEMKNLETLRVDNCPELGRRCEKGRGEEWHKISHIPRVEIDDISNRIE